MKYNVVQYIQKLWQKAEIAVKVTTEHLVEGGWEIDRYHGVAQVANGLPFCLSFQLPQGYHPVFKPHLAPADDMTVGEEAFRCPVIVLENDNTLLALLPQFEQIEQLHDIPYIMNYDAVTRELCFGVGNYHHTNHVYYALDSEPAASYTASLKFDIAVYNKTVTSRRDLRPVEELLWSRYGSRMNNPPGANELIQYSDYAYGWAFERWNDVVWQQFLLDGKEVGGVVFIVCTRQKPGLGAEQNWREPKSLWNQAWFSSLRSAYGYRLYGQRTSNSSLVAKSELALNFALAAPQTNGLFPGYYEADSNNSFENGHWVNACPRRPAGHDDYVHLLDSSWTCYWLLNWYRDIAPRQDIVDYVGSYIKTLLLLQQPDGSFPAWVKPDTLEQSSFLAQSPETAAHVMPLRLWLDIVTDSAAKAAIVRAIEAACRFVTTKVVPNGCWEDFETYWSCAKEWKYRNYGCINERDGLYNQCTFGMYWCAEALLSGYQICANKEFLDAGEMVVAELSLYQQLCHPYRFGDIPTLGGFGVMNSDDEWNDARQSLFALTYLRYYKQTACEKYRLRSLWAMRASYYMMYCPENKAVKALFDRVHPFMNQDDYGFHMENFNHHDGTCVHGIGEFTIFDWGNGAACSSLMKYLDEVRQ